MKWRVLVSAPYFQPVLGRFRERFDELGLEIVAPPVAERLEEEELIPWVADADGVICGDDRFTERVLSAAPRLRVISKWGTGIDSIDVEACRRRGIAVRNTPNAFSEPVADSVLGYMLAFARRLPWMDRDMKSGAWTKLPSVSLGELTLGVIGVGNVGRAVVHRARSFGMRLLGTDVRPLDPAFLEATGLAQVPQSDLLAEADFVSVNCDLNPTSRGLVDAAALARMKPTAVVVNTARGPIVNEAALVDALRRGVIAGAALDVFEVEPLAADSPLRSMDNVFLAPHNSNSSPRAWERVHESTIRNLVEALEASTP
jgi:D-3-phosphoglycerate dehydrogenase